MTFFTVHPFHSFNLAVVLLIAGKILTLNIDLLRRYSIPEPVAGGFLCIAVTGLLWALFCQSALNGAPRSASKSAPFVARVSRPVAA